MRTCGCILMFIFLVSNVGHSEEGPDESYKEKVIPTPSQTESNELKLYYDLPLSQNQESDIYKLVTTLANTSIFGLMFKQGELEDIGKRIYGVHPLRYIGYIYSIPKLKQCMPELLSKSMVATRFIKELSAGFNQKLDQGELKQYMPGFAESLHLELEPLMNFVNNRNWEGLLKYLDTH